MELHIREATAADIDAMHRIRLDVRENRLSDPTWLTPAVYRACLGDTGVANTWVAESADGVLGFCVARVPEQDIWALFVNPAHEGRGIGRALLATATRWLFAHEVPMVTLGTTPDTRADRFYRDAGWQRGEIDAKGEVRYRLPNPSAGVTTVSESASC
ncbi:MAG TPA: GNAT family N-acetyltransferase [Lysobacter sp.]|nr:GNAT family N-acetyltransferase [Lysobacter sp.]